MKIKEFMEACELKRDNQQWVDLCNLDLFKVGKENPRDCKHGQLRRACNICELEKEVEEIEMQTDKTQEWKDILITIAKVEIEINDLKRQIMRDADKIKGAERCEE